MLGYRYVGVESGSRVPMSKPFYTYFDGVFGVDHNCAWSKDETLHAVYDRRLFGYTKCNLHRPTLTTLSDDVFKRASFEKKGKVLLTLCAPILPLSPSLCFTFLINYVLQSHNRIKATSRVLEL